MTNKEFTEKLEQCKNPKDLAVLADEITWELCDGKDIEIRKEWFSQLLDNGLDASIPVDEDYLGVDSSSCIDGFAYIYNEDALSIARMIFEKCGVPDALYYLARTKVDYDCYDVPYVVKLYLLASAYVYEKEETYIRMCDNLYEEMFEGNFTSIDTKSKKMALTPDIFKEIEKYDYSIEMEEQELGLYGSWVLHIFDKESRIEVAQYF